MSKRPFVVTARRSPTTPFKLAHSINMSANRGIDGYSPLHLIRNLGRNTSDLRLLDQ